MPIAEIGQYVGINDVIDVVATSILIYYVLLLIRGTRAVQILGGVLFLVLLLGAANLAHLLLLGTILQLIVLGAAVSLPIVFQPELRRLLERLGRGGLFRFDRSEGRVLRGEDRAIAILAKTAFALARNRYGALIVIEQSSGLQDVIESGTVIGAELSGELLLALFSPRSPLHDGAVIVRDQTVVAAGCFLPLAEQSLGEPRLGTRHRAAVGLTDQADAVVIVISEETGNVAVAREGRLSRDIGDEARLNRLLLACTRAPRTKAREDLIAQVRAIFARRPAEEQRHVADL
ncbi:MAG: TIGR00159 family protein [Candidatus Eremiobacteraeota bacterium]|nr:TIGR00159 family protein [Candidatus Eremiobacteraeota bacterium]